MTLARPARLVPRVPRVPQVTLEPRVPRVPRAPRVRPARLEQQRHGSDTKIRATGAQQIGGNGAVVLQITDENFDTNDEFDPASFTFSPKEDGYSITCEGYVNVATATVLRRVAVSVNGSHMPGNYLASGGGRVSLQSTVLLHLSITNKVNCVGLSDLAAPTTELWNGAIMAHRVW